MAKTTQQQGQQQKQPLKILMLHGYTQSGATFHAKTRALIKHIQKLLPLHTIIPVYPTGPIRLDPADIPGYQQPEKQDQEQEALEAYGWWRRSNTADPVEYLGLNEGLSKVAEVLRGGEGPFDGVIGFSQGACLAAMVASLLERKRDEAFAHFSSSSVGIPFPETFKSIQQQQQPLKFCICYSGFRSPGPRYRAFYEHPPIQTPILHILGSLDAIVDESRSRSLIDACAGDPEKDGRVVWHPGGHFLPSQRPFLDAAVVFIREQLERKGGGDEEEDVHDMDVPF